MAVATERVIACNGVYMIDGSIAHSLNGHEESRLDHDGVKSLVNNIATESNGGKNIWTEGLKGMLKNLCEPSELADTLKPLENEAMLSLVHVLERNKTYILTPDLMDEAGIPMVCKVEAPKNNFPS